MSAKDGIAEAEPTETVTERVAGGSPTTTIVRAVAELENEDPTDVDRPLYDVVDPDALDALVRSADQGSHDLAVTFAYHGYDVTVGGDGTVSVRAR